MMKLAFCLFNYFPYGGLQRDFHRIACLCLDRGHEVHVYTMSVSGSLDPRLHVHLVKAKGWQNHTRIKSFVKQVRHQLNEQNYDVVIGFNKMPHLDFYYAADVCYQARMHAQRSRWTRFTPRYRQLVKFEHAVFARRQQTQVLLISPLQEALFTQFYGTEKERFHLLPPNIDRARIAPPNAAEIRERLRAQFGFTDRQYILLMVGSSFKTKGVDRSIQALAALPQNLRQNTALLIIGTDSAEPYLKLAQQLGVHARVRFLGGRSDIRDIMLSADLLLHPAYLENTGTVLLEAICAGLPVITLDHCGFAPHIEAAQAGLVLHGEFDAQNFQMSIVNILNDHVLRSTWQKNAIVYAKNTDLYSMPEKVVELIETRKVQPQLNNNWLQGIQYIDSAIQTHFSPDTPLFAQMMQLQGVKYRDKEGRITQSIQLGDKPYFIKQHYGIGWGEILKNWLQFKRPIVSAKNEWEAIIKLSQHGVSVAGIASYGEDNRSSTRRQSFVLMEALTETISLETLVENEQVDFKLKRRLIRSIATISRQMHTIGINHRDFYLCHFLLDMNQLKAEQPRLSLIDLHRAQIRKQVPTRWLIKDLAALTFSCKKVKLTKRDFYLFMQYYRNKPLREILRSEGNFWLEVKRRADNYRDHTK